MGRARQHPLRGERRGRRSSAAPRPWPGASRRPSPQSGSTARRALRAHPPRPATATSFRVAAARAAGVAHGRGTAISSVLDKVIERGKLPRPRFSRRASRTSSWRTDASGLAGRTGRSASSISPERLRASDRLSAEVPAHARPCRDERPHPASSRTSCHIAEIEIDPQTGEARLDRYVWSMIGTVVNRCCRRPNPRRRRAGSGQALMEDALYDAEGRLRTGSFMDYAMPRSRRDAELDVLHHLVPSAPMRWEPGLRRGRVPGSLPVVVSAVLDALSELGIKGDRHAGDAVAALDGDRGRRAHGQGRSRSTRPSRPAGKASTLAEPSCTSRRKSCGPILCSRASSPLGHPDGKRLIRTP